MQANVLTAFFNGSGRNIKVYPTQNVKPFKLEKRVVATAFPFLLASAMVLTGCSEKKSPAPQDDSKAKTEVVANPNADLTPAYWNEIYGQVVQRYNLTALKDKEPLSLREIKHLMSDRNLVEPTDTNFNHMPENVENFWAIVKGGIAVAHKVQADSSLTDVVKQKYLDKSIESLSKISKIKGTKDEVDLKDYNNLHAFLFFEKVLHYQTKAGHIFLDTQGWIDEKHELFGRYYQDYLALEEKTKDYSGVEHFAKALYASTDRFILSAQDSVYANALSRKMFEDWCYKQKMPAEHLGLFIDTKDSYYPNEICFGHLRGYSVGISMEIDAKGQVEADDGMFYSPVGLTEIHEYQHVMSRKPASYEKPEDNKLTSPHDKPENLKRSNALIVELGPTLYTLAYSDRIFKAKNKIDRHDEVDYGKWLQIGQAKLSMGRISNWAGMMFEKYPDLSVDKVMQQTEVLQQLHQWGMGVVTSDFDKSQMLGASR